MFAEFGVPMIDVDLIAHQLTAPQGEAIAKIGDYFGREVLNEDQSFNRPKMRQMIFENAAHKKALENILHPLIFAESLAQIEEIQKENAAPYLLLVVPLLVESAHYQKIVDRILVIDCTEEMQIERTIKRSGLTRAEVLAIMNTQASRKERLQAANEVILNDQSTDHLREKIAAQHAIYSALFKT